MTAEQTKALDQIGKLYEKTSHLTMDYWKHFSGFNTWQFWLLFALILLPLVALYFLLDRKRAFHLGFYGFSVHMLFHYVDTFGYSNYLWSYPYKFIPFLASSITLDSALIPVSFMLFYQWTLNKNKNYYLYATGLSLFYSFLVKPALVTFHLFQLHKGMNYFILFLLYIIIVFGAKWITNVFLHFQKEAEDQTKANTPAKRRSFLSRFFRFRQKAH